MGPLWVSDHNTKNYALKDLFTSVFSVNICLQQSQASWELGTRKIYICWKKLKLHLPFCGCNHWYKMQCNIITIGLFISILGQHQQRQLVSFLHSLLEKSNMNHQFLPYPWSQNTGKLFQHMFSQWEKGLDIIINQKATSWQFQKLWKGFDNEEIFRVFCFCPPPLAAIVIHCSLFML